LEALPIVPKQFMLEDLTILFHAFMPSEKKKNHPPIQWVTWVVSPGVERTEKEGEYLYAYTKPKLDLTFCGTGGVKLQPCNLAEKFRFGGT